MQLDAAVLASPVDAVTVIPRPRRVAPAIPAANPERPPLRRVTVGAGLTAKTSGFLIVKSEQRGDFKRFAVRRAAE